MSTSSSRGSMQHPGRWWAAALVIVALAGPGGGFSSAQHPVPTPGSLLGFEPCADYQLATYEQIADYFRTLAAAAPQRVLLVDMGRTVEGRTQLMAIISSDANIRQLGHFKAIARALALGRDASGHPLGDAEARALASEGRAVVWIDFGLHSTEVAHAQTAPRLAFKAVAEDSEEMRFIRDNTILLLVPNMNPDGTTMVASWYMANRGKPWENRLPELYHRYVGHDDNRDFFMMTQPETRNSARQLYAEWFPQIVYNQHQSGPFPSRIFVPPFDDPMNPNIPPLVMRGVNAVGDAITRRLDQEGKRGAISRVGFDTWWNGGMRTAPYFHNMIGILTETAHASATPATYEARTFPKTFANGAPTLEPSTYYPSPFLGGEWHLRNSCDYMDTASMAVLDIAARRRTEWLYDIYQMGRDAVKTGADEAFVVPVDQWDRGTAVKLVNVLRLGGVDVDRADEAFTADGRQYAAGSFVIRGAQPFGAYARDLLTPQVYADLRLYPGGPPKRPYDITGWTLSYQMGVTVDRITHGLFVKATPVEMATVPAVDPPTARAAAYALDPRANDSFTAVNRLLKAGDRVGRLAAPFAANGTSWPAGTFIVTAGSGTRERLAAASRALGLRVVSLSEPPRTTRAIIAPRVGIYHGWGGNMDEGWTRWVLEQFEFPFAVLHDADIRDGRLRQRFDAIVLPDATNDRMVNGLAAGTMPSEYTGGMTVAGIANLRAFASDGGTLVALDHAAELPLTAFGLPVRTVTAAAAPSTFYVPGTLLRVAFDTQHPVAWGMPADGTAFFLNSQAFAIDGPVGALDGAGAAQAAGEARPVATYAARNLVRSGWALGEQLIAGHAAAVDVRFGSGRVVLLGFPPQHRGQPHGTFKLLFNSLLLSAMAPAAP